MKPSELVEQIARQVIFELSSDEKWDWDYSGIVEKIMEKKVQKIIVEAILDNGFRVTKQS